MGSSQSGASPASAVTVGSVARRRVYLDDLVTTDDVADRLRVAPQAVHQWASRFDDFPDPVRVFGRMRIWYWPDVQRWLKAHPEKPDRAFTARS